MSIEVGAHHVWGVILSEFDEDLSADLAEVCRKLDRIEAGMDPCTEEEEADLRTKYETILRARAIDALKEHGIDMPNQASFFWTGDGGDRAAGRHSVNENEVVVGFSMFDARPWIGFTSTPSFNKRAQHLTWIWQG